MGNRKIVQIAVCATASDEGRVETLYALDDRGTMFEWCHENHKYTSGWLELDMPWDHLREKKAGPPIPQAPTDVQGVT